MPPARRVRRGSALGLLVRFRVRARASVRGRGRGRGRVRARVRVSAGVRGSGSGSVTEHGGEGRAARGDPIVEEQRRLQGDRGEI